LVLISAIIPQKDIAENRLIDWQNLLGDNYIIIEKLGLDKIYFTPVFFIVLGLFGLNLILVNIKRFKLIYKLEKNILKARYIGSIIFHFSLIIIICGIILNYLYKFHGTFGITEGQTSSDSLEGYHGIFKGPLYSDDYNRFQIRLDRLQTDFEINGAVTEAADIMLRPTGSDTLITSTIFINYPLRKNDLEFHYNLISGYSPVILLTDVSGEIIIQTFIRLARLEMDGEKRHYDMLYVPGTDLKIEIEVLEDIDENNGGRFDIKVEKNNNLLYDEILEKGETAAFDDYVLSIPRLRRWCNINVVQSPFLNVIFFGFWSGIAGMVIGFISRLLGQRRNK
jgi:hypothetical protein